MQSPMTPRAPRDPAMRLLLALLLLALAVLPACSDPAPIRVGFIGGTS